MRQDAATTGSCTTKILSLPITPISAAAIASLLRRRGADAMGMAGRKGMGIACDFSFPSSSTDATLGCLVAHFPVQVSSPRSQRGLWAGP